MSWEVHRMKSKTSFFNPSLLRKDIVRFAPAWVLYGAFLLLVFSGDALSYDRAYVADSLGASIGGFGWMNLLYAMLCAQLLFGDLFQSRMCNALHALPIRRESWFVTHVLAGLLFSAIPVAAAGLLFFAVLGSYWMAGLLWMAALMMQFVFFFAVAVLSIMLVGNRFAAVVIYCILNFLSCIVLWLVFTLYAPHLYGFVLDETPFLELCPSVWMIQFDWFMAVSKTGRILLGEGWGYLAICAAVGVVVLGGSVLLYRKRALEKAGDFIAFRPLAPVFLVLYTFSAGAFLHLFSNVFVGESTEFVFLIVGLAIGFFTGLMLLQRTIRVFRAKTFARFGILMAVFGLTLLLTVLDPLGLTRWVPAQKDVQWVSLDYYSAEEQTAHAITDKALIKEILSVHQHAVENPQEASNGNRDVNILFAYKLKDGRIVQRQFYVDIDTVAAVTLEHALSQPEVLFGSEFATAAELLEEIRYIELSKEGEMITDREQLRGLAEALIADALEGNLCQNYSLYRDNGEEQYLYIQGKEWETPRGYNTHHYWSIAYTEQSVHTLAWIEENIP